MRIAVVHSFYDPKEPSGENAVVAAQVDELRARGHDVLLVGRHTAELRNGRLYPVGAALAAANVTGPSPILELDAFAPDVVHVHNLFPNWGSGWLERYGDRTVVTLHNYRTVCASGLLWRDGHDCHDCLDKGTWRAIEHRCYRDSWIATLPLAHAARDRGAHQPLLHSTARILVLNSGARELFSSLATAPVQVLANFVRPPDVPSTKRAADRLLFIGRLTPEKGIIELIDDLPAGYGLDILGDGPMRAQVEALADGERIRVHGQQLSADVYRMLASCTALVVPSLWSEGIPTTALEALAMGCPLIVSDKVAAATDLTRGGAGLVYRACSPASLAECLVTIANDPLAFSQAAHTLHAECYSPDAWGKAIEDVYRRVMHSASAGRQRG